MSTTLEPVTPAGPGGDVSRTGWWPRLGSAGLPLLIGLAAANFFWQLGSSSYYVDEIQALGVALNPLSNVIHALSTSEITPPAYFLFLHEWVGHAGSSAAWVARLPSASCGVLLVAAVYWLATALCGRRSVALLAAGLTALSPYVLEYSQLAQNYAFLMLASACAVAACIEAERASGRARVAWMVAGAVASVLALWLHYTAGLVILPLCVWVLTRRGIPFRARLAFAGACLVAELALIPLLVEQHDAIPNRSGTQFTAAVTGPNVERIFSTPLDGRVDSLLLIGVIVTVAALVWLLSFGRAVFREWILLAVIAVGVPVVLFLLSEFGAHLVLTRYVASAAPFMIVAIAAAVVAVRPRPLAGVLAAGALAVAVAGLVASHQSSGFYLNARGVAHYIDGRRQPGDAVLASSGPGSAIPLLYYGLHPDWFDGPTADRLIREHRRRLWVIYALAKPTDAHDLHAYLSLLGRQVSYRVPEVKIFPGIVEMAVALEVPLRAAG